MSRSRRCRLNPTESSFVSRLNRSFATQSPLKQTLPVRLRDRALIFLRPLEGKPPDHGVVAEARTHPVHGMFGDGGTAVDQVGRIGLIGRDQRARANADQPEARAVGLALEQ